MSPRVLTSAHAEDVGTAVVEPGQPIPSDADADVVNRLQAEGKIANTESAGESPSDVKSSRKSSKEG